MRGRVGPVVVFTDAALVEERQFVVGEIHGTVAADGDVD